MKRVLFVDENPTALAELRKNLESDAKLWDISFEENAKTTLARIEGGEKFDVIVCALTMKQMDGTQFLHAAREVDPSSVRMILSDDEGMQLMAKASGVSHQVIGRPCEPHVLRVLITRAMSVRENLASSPILSKLHKLGTLPSLPVIYQEIMRQMNSPDFSLAEVGATIEKDVALSAKLLQIVNSAGSGLRQEISSVPHAASMLGMEKLSAIVLVAEVFSTVQVKAMPRELSLDALWAHSLRVGEYAKKIALHEVPDETTIVEQSFTAGLLHDIGLIILASNLAEELTKAFALAKQKKISLFQAEKEILGATHAQVGGYLLELWGLPDPIVEAIAYHDYPTGLPEEMYPSEVPMSNFTALTAVHVANYFCEDSTDAEQVPTPVDDFFLERLGYTEKMGEWFDECYRP